MAGGGASRHRSASRSAPARSHRSMQVSRTASSWMSGLPVNVMHALNSGSRLAVYSG